MVQFIVIKFKSSFVLIHFLNKLPLKLTWSGERSDLCRTRTLRCMLAFELA